MVNQWINKGVIVAWPDFLSKEEVAWLQSWLDGVDSFSFMTSGSTGNPKEIAFSRRQIEQSALRTARCFALESNQNVLHTLPFGFVAGKMNILRAVILGQNVFSMDWKDAGDWDRLSSISVDWWTSTPMMIQHVLSLGIDIDFIQKILLGGGAIPDQLRSSLTALKSEVYESYGMTETLTHIALRQVNSAVEGPVFFRPIQGVRCSLSKEETLVVEDDVLDVTVLTNDLVRFNGSGEFEIMGRADDVINSGGVKIFPQDVERWMSPFMKGDFAIAKTPHPSLGEQVICLYVSNEENLDQDFWRAIFMEHPFWRPKQFILVERLPYNTNGKLIRNWNVE